MIANFGDHAANERTAMARAARLTNFAEYLERDADARKEFCSSAGEGHCAVIALRRASGEATLASGSRPAPVPRMSTVP